MIQRVVVLSTALAIVAGLSFPVSAVAQQSTARDYADTPAGQTLIDKLEREQNVPRQTTRRLLEQAEYQPDIVAKMERPAEKTMTWGRYRQIFVQPDRARGGVDYMAEHRQLFEQAEAEYGVPAYIIAAILGVETRYGGFIGRDRVLDALATLAFDYPPRSPFFTKELGAFITLCADEQLDCTEEVGSYAGAMGLAQFMPSSYAAYAVDGNDDGQRDLWHQPADIIMSIANYLAENGWRRGEPIVSPAELVTPDAIDDIQPSRRQTRYRWSELSALGVTTDNPPAPDTPVGLLAFVGPHDEPEYWVARHNFFVITTYNTSPLYAMAVYQLGRMIDSESHPGGGS